MKFEEAFIDELNKLGISREAARRGAAETIAWSRKALGLDKPVEVKRSGLMGLLFPGVDEPATEAARSMALSEEAGRLLRKGKGR